MMRNTLPPLASNDWLGHVRQTASLRRAKRIVRTEYAIAPITVKRNGTDVIAGTQLGIWLSGIGYTTYATMPSSHSAVNRNTPTIVKMLRATVRVMSEGKSVAANGTSKRKRTASGALSSLRNSSSRYPNGIIASLAPKQTMQNVNAQTMGRANLIVCRCNFRLRALAPNL